MATPCDKSCDDGCLKDRISVYICLKSEEEFLASLLRLGSDDQGKRNLQGYEPSELIDWFLYAKRSYSTWPSKDPVGWSIKLLDELGKILFGLTQVTAKARENHPDPTLQETMPLLRPLEKKLVDSFLPPGFPDKQSTQPIMSRSDRNSVYDRVKTDAISACKVAGEQLRQKQSIGSVRDCYESDLECRIAYTTIEQVGVFYWDELGAVVLLIDGESRDLNRTLRLKLACAYLHGVARFALPIPHQKLTDKEPDIPSRLGYWIDKCSMAPDGDHRSSNLIGTNKTEKQKFALIPNPSSPHVRLSCELAASLAQEYWGFFDPQPQPEQALFDVLFMCKEQAGWFWCLTESQLQYLSQECWGDSIQRYTRALERFRFNRAGIINHLERTESLVGKVYDFRDEEFICVTVGYHLEDTNEEAENFKSLEESLPLVDKSSYFYFRITSHKPITPLASRKELPEGALVALFRFDRDNTEGSIITRLKRMAVVRHLVERWRAKAHSLDMVAGTVRDLARPVQEKTARAAIMSRNLSHNVGSHALANSRFFEAVGVLNQVESVPADDDNYDPLHFPHPNVKRDGNGIPVRIDGRVQFLMEEVNNKPTGRIEKQNGPVQRGEAWRARNRLASINSYLQGRMDFIARALGETSSQPEPMFFINDLLKGFLSQSVLLNTLLSDNGYTASDLDFLVTFGGADAGGEKQMTLRGVTHDHEIRHADFIDDGTFEDVLVAIPGGMVGRHAFYAFLENFMRNSVKYGARAKNRSKEASRDRFQIHLHLKECYQGSGAYLSNESRESQRKRHACYVLTIYDNLSEDPDGSVADKVRRHLNETIIDDKGRPRTEGHGVQEMKVCASFLAGNEQTSLVFPTDKCFASSGACLGREYGLYVGHHKTHQINLENSLVAYPMVIPEQEGRKLLTYSLLLQQPRLLGIVDTSVSGEYLVRFAQHEPTVVFCNTIEVLAEYPAHFGLIKIVPEKIVDALNGIAACHASLPFRLMLVIENEEQSIVDKLQDQIDTWQRDQAKRWTASPRLETPERIKPFPLPVRRVRVISCAELFEPLLFNAESKKLRELTLKIYDKWICVFKGAELRQRSPDIPYPKWNLAIGFQRSRDTVLKKWNLAVEPGAIDLGFQSSQIDLHLFFEPEGDTGTKCNRAHAKALDYVHLVRDTAIRATLLALDNHGNVIAEEKEKGFRENGAIPVYHEFSGGQQADLFQLLESPPADPISRSFLVYSVAEALLTKIVVIDERVADATLDWPDSRPRAFGEKLRAMQRAGIFPLYSIATQKGGAPHYLSSSANTAVDRARSEYSLTTDEGLKFLPTPDQTTPLPQIQSVTLDSDGVRRPLTLDAGSDQPDFIIIHEGVTDLLHAKKEWQMGYHQALFAVCPVIVRTSGRGSISRYLGDEMPFYEFSELSDFTYRQMNKIALARGLLALRGSLSTVKGK